ncbi:hypothetical protein ACFLWJ_00430 [Chloroflexota bacterium]
MRRSFTRITATVAILALSITPSFSGTANAFSTDTLLADAQASFLGEANADESAISVSSAGDVNGDGYDDFLIGAHKNGGAKGKVYLFLGKATGWSTDTDLASADASFIGETNGFAGFSVAAAGDVNGDAYDDFLIGAYGDAGGKGLYTGQTYLILGKATGWALDTDLAVPTNADASFFGEALGDESGYSVCSAGDVNNDGFDDILIGARKNDGAGSDRGQTYLILGKATGWARSTELADADASFMGEVDADESGSSIAPAGDVNNDNYDDFLIGASLNDEAGADAGQVYLVLGKASGWSADTDLAEPANADASFRGNVAGDQLGESISSAGDVNGDGYDDFLIGATKNDDGGNNAGQTYLIMGDSTGWFRDLSIDNADASFIGEAADDESGNSVACAGDINGDGYDDILIGAKLNDESGAEAGQVYLIYGKSSGWSKLTSLSTVDASFKGENAGDEAGHSISSAGDIDGNGGSEILIGAPKYDDTGANEGKTYLFFGNSFPNAPTTPQSEGNTNPIGIRDITPEFSWNFSDDDAGDSQSAYQILVASSSANLTANNGDLWNSGKVTSTASSNISYAGTTLASSWGATIYWKVKTWDNNIAGGSYCAEQTFIMQTAPNAPISPLCENESNPTGVQDTTPEFGWDFSDPDIPDSQSAYQILVASTSENLTANTGDLWNSGKVASTSSTSITYAGTSLGTSWGTTYYWKVKTWDKSDAEGVYCAEQTFTTQVAPNAPTEPKCEGLTNPIALTDIAPDFSWKFSDDDVKDNQSAYQILVASTSDNLTANTGDLWDSGKVASVASGASYDGTALSDGRTYYWKVKTWDNLGAEGEYCAEQTLTLKNIVLPFWAEITISAAGAAAIASGILWFLMRRKSSPAG